MFAVRKCGLLPHCYFLFLVLLGYSFSLSAQESAREKEKEKEKSAANKESTKVVNLSGSIRCDKPAPSYSLDVPDRPGHSLKIVQRKCTWSKPMVILGAKTKEGVWAAFVERMEGSLHTHSFEVDTLDDGEKITMQTMCIVPAEKGPVNIRGQFNFTLGTGKYKGIKGGGTYEGNLDSEDVMTLNLEGVYEPAVMAGGKK